MPPFHSLIVWALFCKGGALVCPREKKKGLLPEIPREEAEEWNILAMVQPRPSPEYIQVHRGKGRSVVGKTLGATLPLD